MPLLFIGLGLFIIAMTVTGKLQGILDQLFATKPKTVA